MTGGAPIQSVAGVGAILMLDELSLLQSGLIEWCPFFWPPEPDARQGE